MSNPKYANRFWSKVKKGDGCWEWTAAVDRGGYGNFGIDGRTMGAHRVAWTLANNREIPEGLCVCHSCDNRACCNPAHLWLGTQLDNVRDMVEKGRGSTGEDHPKVKHSDKFVTGVIEDHLASGRSARATARKYGLPWKTAHGWISGRTRRLEVMS